jgi:hypothetical protein
MEKTIIYWSNPIAFLYWVFTNKCFYKNQNIDFI